MTPNDRLRSKEKVGIVLVFVVVAFALSLAVSMATESMAKGNVPANNSQANSSEPWTDAQTVTPGDLSKELANTKGPDKPMVVCSGFQFLYEGAHVPGAVFHGPASKPDGLADLKKWAQGIPRSANLVVYCGCCPFEKCPNVRPAFEALRSMGFRHLRVLVLPTSFAKDWVGQGYSYDKGK